MTYTTRACSKVDPALDMGQKIKKLGTLLNNDIVDANYSPQRLWDLRTALGRTGAIVNRKMEVSWQNMCIYVTTTWSDKDAFLRYTTDPLYTEYNQKLVDMGFTITVEEVA